MIRYYQHIDIDRKKWDECILHSCVNLPFAYSWFLDTVSPGWEGIVLDDYLAVMPLTRNRKFTIHYLFQPYFTQQLGIFSLHPADDAMMQAFLHAIPRRYRFVHVNLNESNTICLQMHPDNSHYAEWTTIRNTNLKLSLNQSYDDLQKNYSESHRKNIRRSGKSGLRLSDKFTPGELCSMMKHMMDEKKVRLGNKVYDTLHALMEQSSQHLRFEKVGIRDSNDSKLYAAAFFIFNKKGITYFSATDPESKNNKAMFFLLDAFIRDHAGNDLTLDFSGSNIYSVAEFFSGFGARPVAYPTLHINRLPFPLKLFKK